MASLYYIKKEHKSSSFVFNHKDENNKEKSVSTVYMFAYIHTHTLSCNEGRTGKLVKFQDSSKMCEQHV